MTAIASITYVGTFLVLFVSAAVLLRRRYTGGQFEAELRGRAAPIALPVVVARERDHSLAA